MLIVLSMVREYIFAPSIYPHEVAIARNPNGLFLLIYLHLSISHWLIKSQFEDHQNILVAK